MSDDYDYEYDYEDDRHELDCDAEYERRRDLDLEREDEQRRRPDFCVSVADLGKTYSAYRVDGREFVEMFQMGSNGQVYSREVWQPEVPAAVWTALQDKVREAKSGDRR